MTENAPLADELAPDLAPVLARMSGVLLSRENVDTAVRLVSTLAEETLPASAGAAVTLVDDAGKRTMAASDAVTEQADALQYDLDEGPCLMAWRTREPVRVDDTATETRFPRWCPGAAALGVRAALSVPLLTGEGALGAIKVYSERAGAYDTRAERMLGLFAQQAAILLANVQSLEQAQRHSEQLKEALATRDVIGQAKGVLMAQGAPDERAAFAILVAASQRSNVNLREVAGQVVASAIARSAGSSA